MHKTLTGFLSSPVSTTRKVNLPSLLKQDEIFSDGFTETRLFPSVRIKHEKSTQSGSPAGLTFLLLDNEEQAII